MKKIFIKVVFVVFFSMTTTINPLSESGMGALEVIGGLLCGTVVIKMSNPESTSAKCCAGTAGFFVGMGIVSLLFDTVTPKARINAVENMINKISCSKIGSRLSLFEAELLSYIQNRFDPRWPLATAYNNCIENLSALTKAQDLLALATEDADTSLKNKISSLSSEINKLENDLLSIKKMIAAQPSFLAEVAARENSHESTQTQDSPLLDEQVADDHFKSTITLLFDRIAALENSLSNTQKKLIEQEEDVDLKNKVTLLADRITALENHLSNTSKELAALSFLCSALRSEANLKKDLSTLAQNLPLVDKQVASNNSKDLTDAIESLTKLNDLLATLENFTGTSV